jgi:protein-tyrosine phosphatase
MKVLMVCLGNICRSPLAEGILRDKLLKNGLSWEVDSAGTGGWHIDSLPDRRSIEVAKKYGIDITYQRARKIRGIDFEEFDLIFAMDQSNFNDLMRLAVGEEERRKIKMILNETAHLKGRSVPDPYWDDNGFEEVFHMLTEACDRIIERYRQ